MIGAIHHAALRVRSLDEAEARWSRLLGLTGERAGDRALLRCAHEDYALLLRESAAKPGLDYVAYELERDVSVEDAAARLSAHGVMPDRVDLPGRGTGLRLEDPDGNGVVLAPWRRGPNDSWPCEVQFSDVLPGFHPRKLGHVNYLTGDVRRVVDWYIEVLGFRLTDRIGSEGAWLHVNADHHVLAFLEKGFVHVHHLAFELVDWGEMRVALDHLAQHRRPLVWGPGRHGMARNLFSYWRMPEEDLFVELYADMEQLRAHHEPRYYEDAPHSSNTWGILPPRSYFRFDDEAIASEQAQTEAYGATKTSAAAP
jgi:catechol-2,3-dioxygenase